MAAIGLAVLIGGTMGCTTAAPSSPRAAVHEFISDGWSLGRDWDAIHQRLGPPVRIDRWPFRNYHAPDQIDEVRRLGYEGLDLTFYVVAEVPERHLLIDISVSSRKYDVRWGLRVGAGIEHVWELLGDGFEALTYADLVARMPYVPADCGVPICAYHYSDGSSHVYFTVRNGRVTRIDWAFSID